MIDIKKVSETILTVFELGLAMYISKVLLEYDEEERARRKNKEMLEKRFREEMEKLYEEQNKNYTL